jgi:hypothetical protein
MKQLKAERNDLGERAQHGAVADAATRPQDHADFDTQTQHDCISDLQGRRG